MYEVRADRICNGRLHVEPIDRFAAGCDRAGSKIERGGAACGWARKLRRDGDCASASRPAMVVASMAGEL
jgi:hypothetical protein